MIQDAADILTPGQIRVMRASISGADREEVAASLGIATGTLEKARGEAMARMGAQSPYQAGYLCAARFGLEPLDVPRKPRRPQTVEGA